MSVDVNKEIVIGVPDKKYGEQVCAWVKVKSGVSLTEVQIREYCKDKMSHYKVILSLCCG
jgi:fatty-acyl-CoA synthase